MKSVKRSQDQIYFEALRTRDPRFDGKFYVGVKTTGIYCRPICPARPHPKNVKFFADALSAQKAGYRACLRCRPETAPFSAAWVGKKAVVQRALKMMKTNLYHELGEENFSEKLGISARHLRRLFKEELGQKPKDVAEGFRLDQAQKLILETKSPITEIAYASGYRSIRRFNDAIKRQFQCSPTVMREERGS